MRREDYDAKPVIRYFNSVSLKEKVYELSELVDIKTFRRMNDDKFVDKNLIYNFSGHPNTFPQIRATKNISDGILSIFIKNHHIFLWIC
ncbi:hypothetical protein CHU92_01500 [Flavobacterium cyanobacteriorum]|uniref:Uncharacterized protein n=1 Tax=Flavobacterium cyanobacteriorum TaxID=2022802 RepID=A0A255ZXZ9_9FLAO|nr:hypothetical protein [Flavobacterium cyanobacteriorum]OYQ46368.1 hypothetical protein CHU92_01500 [Flavobacterium cyanobacteriorum]